MPPEELKLGRKDKLFSQPLTRSGLFTFDASVANVFPDMINRSVPGYPTVIAMTGPLAAKHARSGSSIYDLGCSWGASLLSTARQEKCKACRLIGVDNSEEMLKKANKYLAKQTELPDVDLWCEDIVNVPFENASVVILNYALQFIPIKDRTPLLRRIREAMRPGDALILSEKLVFSDDGLNTYFNNLHYEFKRQQGYSDLEIAQKRAALENVLVPETRETHQKRMRRVGFTHSEIWFQSLNFASLIGIA